MPSTRNVLCIETQSVGKKGRMHVPRWQRKLAFKLRESPNKICRKRYSRCFRTAPSPSPLLNWAHVYKEAYSYSAKTPFTRAPSAYQKDCREGVRFLRATPQPWNIVQRMILIAICAKLNRGFNSLIESTNILPHTQSTSE